MKVQTRARVRFRRHRLRRKWLRRLFPKYRKIPQYRYDKRDRGKPWGWHLTEAQEEQLRQEIQGILDAKRPHDGGMTWAKIHAMDKRLKRGVWADEGGD